MVLLFVHGFPLAAQDVPTGRRDLPEAGLASTSAFTLRFDNDTFNGTDRGFTGALTLGGSDIVLDPDHSVSALPGVGWDPDDVSEVHVSFAIGQKVYTPDDIRASAVVPQDRPYAGVLHASGSLRVVDIGAARQTSAMLGWVGPGALARQSQHLLHRLIHSPRPRGWDNQLSNEPLVQLDHEHRWVGLRAGDTHGPAIQVAPLVAAGLGNLAVFGGVGGEVRLGWNMSRHSAASVTRPGGFRAMSPLDTRVSGLEVFAQADGKIVLHNLLLDGNTFRDSPRVEREPFTGDLMVGASARLGRLALRFETIFWTRRFESEARRQRYSAVEVR